MDLKRLRLLYELSLLGTITKVAQKQGLTRPAISQQLSLLEREVGAALFERSGRGVKLTATGRSLVKKAVPVFGLIEGIQSEIDLVRGGHISGEIRLCAFGSAIGALMPHVVKILAEKYPGLDVRITEQESSDGLKAVATRQSDLAIVQDFADMGFLANLLEFQLLCTDDFVAVLSGTHPLSTASEINLEDLAADRWAINTASEPYHSLLINACSERGFAPNVRASCRNMLATLALVRSGAFVTVLPFFGVHGISHGHDLVVVRLREPVKRSVRVAVAKGYVARPIFAAVLDALHMSAGLLRAER